MTAPQLQDLVLFLDDPETGDEAGLVSGLARVVTGAGPLMVPGTRHLDVPHLAVTSRNLGTFDVTHLPTGVTVMRDFDTMGAALLAMAQLHAIRSKYRLDLSAREPEAIRDALYEVDGFPVPFAYGLPSVRPSVGAWLQDARTHTYEWMLPWETPAQLVREAIEMIAMVGQIVTTPTEVDRAV